MKLLVLILVVLSMIVNVSSFTFNNNNIRQRYSNILMSKDNNNNNIPIKSNEYYQNKIINLLTIPITLTSLALSANADSDNTVKKTKKPKVKETELGIKYIELKKGEGLFPNKGDYVVIDYTGFLPDGKPFDTTIGKGKKFKPLAFRFGEKQLIPGLESVLENMQPGKYIIIIIVIIMS
jgi:FKBP-type peptidyl-prolyl cis-trans isomerase